MRQQKTPGLTPDEAERLHELDELAELGEELDEDDKEERTQLRQQARDANRKSTAHTRWNKARTVLHVSFPTLPPGETFYTLTQQTVQDMARRYGWNSSDYHVVTVDRQTLPDGAFYDVEQDIYCYENDTLTQE